MQVIVDFSHPSCLCPHSLAYCRSHPGVAAVLCTTGYSEEQTREIQEASKALPLFYSRNMSLGVNLLIELAKKAEAVLGDELRRGDRGDAHHNQKIDAPSGTALMIADAINEVRDRMRCATPTTATPSGRSGKSGRSACTLCGAAPSWGSTR